ncbi:Bis(5'-nucleosyl)-tetraphosphatase [asymmetrical] [Leucoagaricus sp. SymC.cos]|nr:Bis(5'-nucleosyl)-tetraphosphatase [asymmetrical] [Leucoagaricus sp. SymC.cos]
MSFTLLFSTFEVSRQAFYCTSFSYAIVNLKPIVPGHVLVIPTRPVPRLADLNASELTSVMHSVQRVGAVIERAYGADALTVACQDGKAAGQSVPHVHFHLLPRKAIGDRFSANNDTIYPALEASESSLVSNLEKPRIHRTLEVDADENRPPRTLEDMEKEARWLRTLFKSDEIAGLP